MRVKKFPMTRGLVYLVVLIACVALPYVFVSSTSRIIVITALLYSLMATSWNLTLGFAGIFNFAHVGFFGLGGYAWAIATVRWEWDPWIALLVGGVAGALAGAIAFIPVIRMRGIYIALITFVFVQLCLYLVLATPDLTGGSGGMTGMPSLKIGAFDLRENFGVGYLWLLGLATAAVVIGLDQMVRGSYGRSLIAIRDNEPFATSRGIDRRRQQLLSFIYSGAIAGVSGALYVSYFRVADTTLFSFTFVTLGLSMIFLGGSGHVWGPVIGAVLVTLVDKQLTQLGPWQSIIIGGVTVLVLIFMPKGIAGGLESAARRLFRASPTRGAGKLSETQTLSAGQPGS